MHEHDHGAGRFLGAAFWVAALILAAEAVGGVLSHSLALLSDAGHMLTDVAALAFSWYAVGLAHRSPTPTRTYGYCRAGILAALANGALLVAVAVAILVEAASRLAHPVAVHANIVWIVALIGLTGNLAIGLGLGGHRHGGDLNVRSAWLHIMGDAAASAGVLVAGLLIRFTGVLWVDPLVSIGIALLIGWGARRVLLETVDVLMEGAPPQVDRGLVAAAMETVPAVQAVHHVHVWTLGSNWNAMSGHVVLADCSVSEAQAAVRQVERVLASRFGIEHTTIQVEAAGGPPCGPRCEDARPA